MSFCRNLFLFLFVFAHFHCEAYLPRDGETLSLEEMIDIALRNNPDTRFTWAQAWAEYWRYRQTLSTNYPEVDYVGVGNNTHVSRKGSGNDFTETTYNQDLILSYLVFDFGVRYATQESARYSFLSSNFFRDWTIQNVILEVIERYIQYLDARETVRAREADVEDTKVNFEVADALYEAGVKNVADALQAKAALVNSQLRLVEAEGQVEIAMSALKNVLAIPMTLNIQPKHISEDFSPRDIAFQMDELIETAICSRSDLKSSYSEVLRSIENLRRANADGLPFMNLEWNIGRKSGVIPRENYHTNTALILTVPLYRGYFFESGKRRARYDLEAQKAFYENTVLDATLEVATFYWDFKTAYQRYVYSVELLKYSEESYEVNLANYKAGIGSIQALFDAQNSLTNARTQFIQAKTAWILSLSRLIHAIGKLTGQRVPQEISPEKKIENSDSLLRSTYEP